MCEIILPELPRVPVDHAALNAMPLDGTTSWCEKFPVWYFDESGMRPWYRPCESFRCPKHAEARANKVLTTTNQRWQQESDVYFTALYDVVVPTTAFHDRIRQLAKRRGDRANGGRLGHHLTVLRDFRLSSDGRSIVFDAAVFSNVDLSSADMPFPLKFGRFDPPTALRLLAYWLRLPGIEKVNGSTGDGGWHVLLESTQRKRDRESGDSRPIGAMPMERARLIFERVAESYHQEHGVRLQFDVPPPPGVPINTFRKMLTEERIKFADFEP
jgi:hypothetical protein